MMKSNWFQSKNLALSFKNQYKNVVLNIWSRKGGVRGNTYNIRSWKDYLMPSNVKITYDEKRNIFVIRNWMVLIPSNCFAKQNVEICICVKVENMKHLYMCEYWNKGEISENSFHEDIFIDNIKNKSKWINNSL